MTISEWKLKCWNWLSCSIRVRERERDLEPTFVAISLKCTVFWIEPAARRQHAVRAANAKVEKISRSIGLARHHTHSSNRLATRRATLVDCRQVSRKEILYTNSLSQHTSFFFLVEKINFTFIFSVLLFLLFFFSVCACCWPKEKRGEEAENEESAENQQWKTTKRATTCHALEMLSRELRSRVVVARGAPATLKPVSLISSPTTQLLCILHLKKKPDLRVFFFCALGLIYEESKPLSLNFYFVFVFSLSAARKTKYDEKSYLRYFSSLRFVFRTRDDDESLHMWWRYRVAEKERRTKTKRIVYQRWQNVIISPKTHNHVLYLIRKTSFFLGLLCLRTWTLRLVRQLDYQASKRAVAVVATLRNDVTRTTHTESREVN